MKQAGDEARRATVLVTGAGHGIGREVARAMYGQAWNVAVAALHEPSARAIAAEFDAVRTLGLWGDVSRSAVPDRWIDDVVERWGGLDALVHCAGSFHRQPALEMSDEDWRGVMALNLDGVFYTVRAAGRAMRQRGGNIVLISSMWARSSGMHRAAYAAAKAGVEALVRSLAGEWASLNIRFYAVAPGWVRTERNATLLEQGVMNRAAMEAAAPIRALVEPDEVARLSADLAAGRHPMLSGSVLRLDGHITRWISMV